MNSAKKSAPFFAPVFMFSMGVGIVYSRRQSSNFLIKRGIKTFFLGIVVTIGEFFVPHYLSGLLLGEWNIFPAMGYFLGTYYIRCMDKKRFLSFWPLGLALSSAYFVSSWYIPNGFLSEVHYYYFMATVDAFFLYDLYVWSDGLLPPFITNSNG